MERLGEEVQRELARGGSRDAIPLAAVTAAWPDAVGDAVSRKAWPLRLGRDGTLHVAAASATWANELSLLQDEILAALRARLHVDAPSAIRFAVGPIPEPEGSLEVADETTPERLDVPPEVERDAAAAAAEIGDPELRKLAARAARASLLKGRSGRHF